MQSKELKELKEQRAIAWANRWTQTTWARMKSEIISPTWILRWEVDLDEDHRLFLDMDVSRSFSKKLGHPVVDFSIQKNVPSWFSFGYIPGHVLIGESVHTLRGVGQCVDGDLVISYCKLKTFDGMPETIKGKIWAIGSKVESFHGYTQSLDKFHGSTDTKNAIKGLGAYKIIDKLLPPPKTK